MMLVVWVLLAVLLVFGLTAFLGAPYVPSQRKYLHDAFTVLYKPRKNDVLLDIGSGDGVVLRTFASYGGRAVGYEINPLLVVLSKWLSRGIPEVQTRLANIWRTPFPPDTTVVYVFGDSRDIKKFLERIESESKRLGRPLKVLSFGFELPGKKALKQSSSHYLYEIR